MVETAKISSNCPEQGSIAVFRIAVSFLATIFSCLAAGGWFLQLVAAAHSVNHIIEKGQAGISPGFMNSHGRCANIGSLRFAVFHHCPVIFQAGVSRKVSAISDFQGLNRGGFSGGYSDPFRVRIG